MMRLRSPSGKSLICQAFGTPNTSSPITTPRFTGFANPVNHKRRDGSIRTARGALTGQGQPVQHMGRLVATASSGSRASPSRTKHATKATLKRKLRSAPKRAQSGPINETARRSPARGKSEPIFNQGDGFSGRELPRAKKHASKRSRKTIKRFAVRRNAVAPCHRRNHAVLMMIERPYYTPRQAAPIVGVTTQSLTRWCRDTPGFARRVGGRWRIDADALARMLHGEAPPPRADAQVPLIAAAALPQ